MIGIDAPIQNHDILPFNDTVPRQLVLLFSSRWWTNSFLNSHGDETMGGRTFGSDVLWLTFEIIGRRGRTASAGCATSLTLFIRTVV